MASPSGSQSVFLAAASETRPVLLVDSGSAGTITPAANFNIEVFATAPGTVAAGFDGGVFIQNAVLGFGNNLAFSPTNSETLLTGNFEMIDAAATTAGAASLTRTQAEMIALGSGSQTVLGSKGDTITAGDGAALPDVTRSNPWVLEGAQTAMRSGGTPA